MSPDFMRAEPTRNPSAPRERSSESSEALEKPLSQITIFEWVWFLSSSREVSRETASVFRFLLFIPTMSAGLWSDSRY